jgi:hypothetical protein
MANNLAYLALIAWPLISVFLYRRFDPITATFCTIVGGLLILPVRVEIDFPLIPPLDKSSISVLSAFFCLRFIHKKGIRLLPITQAEKFLTILFIIIPIITVSNNQETIISIEGAIKYGLTYGDAVSAISKNYILLMPFIIGIFIVRTYEDQVLIFKLATIAGLIYSLPILFEVRMSPQLHTWVYGFFPHDFAQQKRYGGFRPVVFLGHGLDVAMFITITVGTAASIWREKLKIKNFPNAAIVVFLLIILMLCKSVGPFLYGLFLLIAIRLFRYKTLIRGSVVIASLFLLYPLLSLGDLFPHQFLLNLAGSIDPDRAQSLQTRFTNEAELLEHAYQKIYFGWGGWGRNRLDNSITDGAWIIMVGEYGLLGFGAIAGLGWLAIWRGYKSIRFLPTPQMKNLMASHALIISIILIDQILNTPSNIWTWFLIGALVGRTIGIKDEALNKSTRKPNDPANL